MNLAARERASLEKQIATVAPATAVSERVIDIAPKPKDGHPRFSPLAFETDGALLVETADGVSRVRLPEATTEDAAPSVEPWPLAVGAGTDPRWTGVAYPCDRSEVLLLMADQGGGPLPPEPLRVLAPRPGACGRSSKEPGREPRSDRVVWGRSTSACSVERCSVRAIRRSSETTSHEARRARPTARPSSRRRRKASWFAAAEKRRPGARAHLPS